MVMLLRVLIPTPFEHTQATGLTELRIGQAHQKIVAAETLAVFVCQMAIHLALKQTALNWFQDVLQVA